MADVAMQYRFEGFMYFYIFLAIARWAIPGARCAALRLLHGRSHGRLALGIAWLFSEGKRGADRSGQRGGFCRLRGSGEMFSIPTISLFYVRVQEIVVFALVAVILSVTVRRYGICCLATRRWNASGRILPATSPPMWSTNCHKMTSR